MAREYTNSEIRAMQADKLRRDAERPTIRDQLHNLCVALESGRPSVPQTPDQWRRCLTEIQKGGDWENGTWR